MFLLHSRQSLRLDKNSKGLQSKHFVMRIASDSLEQGIS
jgi:hypothetical protein